jgi:fibronectin-binding autotransporter adhesin
MRTSELMKRAATQSLLTLSVLIGMMGVAKAQTPFVNPDFSTGDLSGWTFGRTNNGPAGGSATVVSGAAVVTGNDSGGSGHFAYITQSATLAYTFEFDLRSYTSTDSGTFDRPYVSLNGQNYLLTTGGTLTPTVNFSGAGVSNAFQVLSTRRYSFTVTPGTYQVRLGVFSSDGIIGAGIATFDNIATSASNITGTGPFLSSNLGIIVNPVFGGGTLQGNADTNTALNFTLAPGVANTINAGGFALTFTGGFSNATSGTPSPLTVTGTGSAIFGGANGTELDPLGLFTNGGTVVFDAGSSSFFTAVNNSGSLTNNGNFNDDLNNIGALTNNAAFAGNVNNSTASGVITNSVTGVWTGDLLSNTTGATVSNEGAWTGAANNSATLNNTGTWTGNVTNNAGGALVNGGTITGLVSNSGTATSTGTIGGGLTTFNGSTTNIAGTLNGTVTNSGALNYTGATSSNSALNNATSGTLTVNTGAVVTITGGNQVTNNSTQIDGMLINGTLSIDGLFVGWNDSRLTIGTTGTFNFNNGTVITGAVVSNSGVVNSSITNSGAAITNEASGTWNGILSQGQGSTTNNGTWNGAFGVAIGTATNAGTWTNTTVNNSSVNTGGTFTNSGTYTGRSISVFNAGSQLINTGTLTINVPSTSFGVSNSGAVTNSGTINAQTFLSTGGQGTNNAGGTWTGAINNQTGATFINNGSVTTSMTNAGTLTSTGSLANLTNQSGGVATVSGTMLGVNINSGQLTFSGATTLSNLTTSGVNGRTTVNAGVTVSGVNGLTNNSINPAGLTINGTLNSAGLVTLNSGSFTTVGAAGVFTDTLAAGPLRMTVGNGAQLSNLGTTTFGVTVNGVASNTGVWTGQFYVGPTGSLFNTGTWTVAGTSQTTIEGFVFNGGNMNVRSLEMNGSGAEVFNSGTMNLTEVAVSSIRNGAGLENTGDWTGYYLLVEGGGAEVLNSGSIDSYVDVRMGGRLENRVGATIANDFVWVFNGGALFNSGEINSASNVGTGGAATNEATGVWTNYIGVDPGGAFTNLGSATFGVGNSGTLISTGAIANLNNQVGGVASISGTLSGDNNTFGLLTFTGPTTLSNLTLVGTQGRAIVNVGVTVSGVNGLTNSSTDAQGLVINGTLNSAGSVTLNNGSFTTVGAAGTLTDTLAAGPLRMTVNNGASISNLGTTTFGVSVNGVAFNENSWTGQFYVGPTGSLINTSTGTWTVADAGQTTIEGFVVNDGNMTIRTFNVNGANGFFANNGTFTTDIVNSFVRNGGYAENFGVWTAGLVRVEGANSAIFNNGTMNLAVEVWDGGDFTNDTSGTLSSGYAFVSIGSTFFNAGVINNSFTNAGLLTSTGALNNGLSNSGLANISGTVNGSIDNNDGGTLNIVGVTSSNGSLFAYGDGAVTVATGATWTGLTYVDLSATGTDGLLVNGAMTVAGDVEIFGGARLRVGNGGIFTANNVYNFAGGTVRVDAGGVFDDDLFNSGVASNAGALNANVENTGDAAQITNTGVWTGNVLVNSGGAAIINQGAWNGTAANASSISNASGGTWTGALTNQGTGTVQNFGAWNGTVSNAGQFNNASGGSVSGLLTNTGLATNAGTLNGGATITAGSLITTGTVNGPLTNSATVQATGAVNGAINNSGVYQVSGPLTSTGGSFTNLSGGSLLNATSNYTGIGAITNAANGQIVIGNGVGNGLVSGASLANSGNLLMLNNRVGDRMTVSGAFTGSGAAAMTVDLNMASNANLADRLLVGSSTGTTAVTLNNVGGPRIYFSNPIVLVQGGNGQGFALASNASTTAAMANNGIIDYAAQALPGGGWGIVSVLNGPLLSTVSGDSLAFLSAGSAALKPNTEDLAAGDAKAPQGAGQVWGLFESSALETKGVVRSSDPFAAGGPVSGDLDIDGFKIGGAMRVFASNSFDLDFGVAAAIVNGETRQNGTGYRTSFEMPTYGVYAVASFDALQIDLQYDVLELNVDGSKIISAKELSGEGSAVRLGINLPIQIDGGTMTPFFRAETITMDLGGTPAPGGTGALTFSDLDITTLQAGVRTRLAMDMGEWALTPGLDISLGKEEGKGSARFTPVGGASAVQFDTPRDSAYLDVALGGTMRFMPNGLEFYVKVNSRSGDDISGLSGTLGARFRF